MSPSSIPSITPTQLADELKSPNPPVLLDVREGFELSMSALPNAVHLPMGEIPSRIGELSPESDIVVICRSGARSAQVTRFLLANGFLKVRNLTTGLNGWSRDVDRNVRAY